VAEAALVLDDQCRTGRAGGREAGVRQSAGHPH
jgi:hypothetical protein